ncbi:hypothetical protein BU26DRAFT_599977 [Trematosphaeria pertusa]|uniref:Uncharacterized protein n=1 Tax=Trematosphaeria pertusa TaxID=390896 RepID=A0A6A6IUC7_9PLEO|nr:uncharacterized protein BU26DRAFT_599977 [Trematosphaeria pertusa]KAF2254165.1 hypothetical protein BU26DRAFT_599977 [Trematosphaeria pertusa]
MSPLNSIGTAAYNDNISQPGCHSRSPYAADQGGLGRGSAVLQLAPDDKDQPEISPAHLKEIKDIIMNYRVQEKFGIHLVHSHLQVDKGKIMHGMAMASLRGC